MVGVAGGRRGGFQAARCGQRRRTHAVVAKPITSAPGQTRAATAYSSHQIRNVSASDAPPIQITATPMTESRMKRRESAGSMTVRGGP